MKKINFLVLVFALVFAVTANAADKIMIVHGGDAEDLHILQLDTIVQSMGYETELVDVTQVTSNNAADYVAVLISEKPGSSNFGNSSLIDFLTSLPCVSLKSFGFRADKGGWNWFANNADEWKEIKSSAYPELEDISNVENTSAVEAAEDHPIWTNIAAAGESVPLMGDTLDGNGSFQTMDLSVGPVASGATKIGILLFAENDAEIIPDGVIWAVDEPTVAERTVIYGIHSNWSFSEQGAELVKNSLLWAMGEDIPVATAIHQNSIPSLKLRVFPNPARGLATITFNKNITSNVVLTKITGQKVNEFTPQGNKVFFETNNYTPGIYFVSVENETVKLIIK